MMRIYAAVCLLCTVLVGILRYADKRNLVGFPLEQLTNGIMGAFLGLTLGALLSIAIGAFVYICTGRKPL